MPCQSSQFNSPKSHRERVFPTISRKEFFQTWESIFMRNFCRTGLVRVRAGWGGGRRRWRKEEGEEEEEKEAAADEEEDEEEAHLLDSVN
jgi:hypothetical protein